MLQKIFALLKSERGSVEAAMVLIPLLFLFLIGAQLTLTVHARNVESAHIQNDANIRGITGTFTSEDRILHLESGGDGKNLDLLITQKQSSLISLLPTLPFLGGRLISVHGIAIVENQR